MTGRIGKPCKYPRCSALVEYPARYCETHSANEPKAFERKQQQRLKLYGTVAWERARLAILRRDSFKCVRCGGTATVVHHIIEARQAPHLVLEDTNLESLCSRCHNRESQREAGKPAV